MRIALLHGTRNGTRRRFLKSGAAALTAAFVLHSPPAVRTVSAGMAPTSARWLRGQTHAHTTYSPDADSTPEAVVDWYAAHDYDFLFPTDHDAMIPPAHLAELNKRGMAVWPGVEVGTVSSVHVNGLGITQPIDPLYVPSHPLYGAAKSVQIRWISDQIRQRGGVEQVNHPSWQWTLSTQDILNAGEVRLLEIANMIHTANNEGDAAHPSTEAMWDSLLSAGRCTWGVASDDTHQLKTWGPQYANPGRGWVQVRASSLSMGAVLQSLSAGQFVACAGLEVSDYRVSADVIDVELKNGPALLELVGPGGRILQRVRGHAARFTVPRSVAYVRVRGRTRDDRRLWCQPVFRG